MEKIFPRSKNDEIIRYMLKNPSKPARVSEISKALKVNKSAVSIMIKKLERMGVLKGKQADLGNPLVKALKVLINIESMFDSGALALLKSRAVSAGIYGSVAKGTDIEASDVDIWIIPKKNLDGLQTSRLMRLLSDLLSRQVQMVVLDGHRLESMKKDDTNFYHSLVFGSILLFGDGIE